MAVPRTERVSSFARMRKDSQNIITKHKAAIKILTCRKMSFTVVLCLEEAYNVIDKFTDKST